MTSISEVAACAFETSATRRPLAAGGDMRSALRSLLDSLEDVRVGLALPLRHVRPVGDIGRLRVRKCLKIWAIQQRATKRPFCSRVRLAVAPSEVSTKARISHSPSLPTRRLARGTFRS